MASKAKFEQIKKFGDDLNSMHSVATARFGISSTMRNGIQVKKRYKKLK